MYMTIVWSGFLIDFMIYNERRETAETSNSFLQKELPSSYEVEIQAYSSKVKESNTPFLVYNATSDEKPDANPNDLCQRVNHNIIDSTYFKNALKTNQTCKRVRLNEFTDKYVITVKYYDIPKSDIKDQFVSMQLKSDYTQVVHFFKWRLKSIWDYSNGMEAAWSELEGIMTPQTLKDTNKNITSGFKGEVPTVIYFSLIPTHYVDEISGLKYKGYRVHLSKFERGSTVNKRTLTNRYTALGDDLEGFQVQFMINTASTLFQVRIEKIKSVIELFAYMLGFLAGFILVVRVAKYYLLRETYFLELEKQCEKMFGRHSEFKREDDDDDITNIELMRLERSRARIMNNSTVDKKQEHNEQDRLKNRNSDAVQLDKSDLNEDDENDLKKLEI